MPRMRKPYPILAARETLSTLVRIEGFSNPQQCIVREIGDACISRVQSIRVAKTATETVSTARGERLSSAPYRGERGKPKQ